MRGFEILLITDPGIINVFRSNSTFYFSFLNVVYSCKPNPGYWFVPLVSSVVNKTTSYEWVVNCSEQLKKLVRTKERTGLEEKLVLMVPTQCFVCVCRHDGNPSSIILWIRAFCGIQVDSKSGLHPLIDVTLLILTCQFHHRCSVLSVHKWRTFKVTNREKHCSDVLKHVHCALCISRWVAEHYVKTWYERNFSLLSPELHRACLTAVTSSMVSWLPLGSYLDSIHQSVHQLVSSGRN